MTMLLSLYRRLDLLQHRLWFRIAMSVLFVALAGAVFVPLITKASSLHSQRVVLSSALRGQSLARNDEHALSLRDRGEVVVDGRRYGGENIRRIAIRYFAGDGSIAESVKPELIERLLADQIPTWAPRFLVDYPGTTMMLGGIVVGWLLLIVWMGLTIQFFLTLIATAIPVQIARLAGSEQWALALAGMGILTFTFILLTRAMLYLLRFPIQPLAVAHTLVKEASRLRLSLAFIVLLLVILPLLPMFLDPAAPLRFRIQTFISRSMSITFVLAACMTLFLSCATVAFEIRDRQIWHLVTKPLSRFHYLLGKWIGVMTVNLIIVAVAGVSIFTYIQYLRTLPVAAGAEGQIDRATIVDEVLTARVYARPVYQRLTGDQLRQRVDQMILNDPDLANKENVPLALKQEHARVLVREFLREQRTLPPGQRRDYTFSGLRAAKDLNANLTFRYQFFIGRSDEHESHPIVFAINMEKDADINAFAGLHPDRVITNSYVPTMFHNVTLPPDFIRDDGTLTITAVNIGLPGKPVMGTINFDEEDFEILFKVGNFESNFLRAVIVSWLKLAFLAMLGIACATVLSFPVACMASFTVFVAGSIGPFLGSALEQYYPPETSTMDWSNLGMVIQWVFQNSVRSIAWAVWYVVGSFGEFQPVTAIVEGKYVGWGTILSAMIRLVFFWTLPVLVVGYLIFRRRQLATYSGHG